MPVSNSITPSQRIRLQTPGAPTVVAVRTDEGFTADAFLFPEPVSGATESRSTGVPGQEQGHNITLREAFVVWLRVAALSLGAGGPNCCHASYRG